MSQLKYNLIKFQLYYGKISYDITILESQLILAIICRVRLDEIVEEPWFYIIRHRLLQFIYLVLYGLAGLVVNWRTRIYTWCFFGFASAVHAAIPSHRFCHAIFITAGVRSCIAIIKACILGWKIQGTKTTIILDGSSNGWTGIHIKEEEWRKIIILTANRWMITSQ